MSPNAIYISLFILSLGFPASRGDVEITLRRIDNSSTEYKGYYTIDLSKSKFTSTGELTGYLHQPTGSKDGCSFIPTIPNDSPKADDNRTVMWIAVIENYTTCPEAMVSNVRGAGYRLILASSRGDINNSLTSEIRSMGFPVVIIEEWYSTYLIENALSELDDPQILATVSTRLQVLIVIIMVVVCLVFFPLCFLCCVCCMWCTTKQRRVRHAYEARNQAVRQRNYSRLQNREQRARQELIESILRQLQQLQLDSNTQHPLGAELTRQLPIETYSMLDKSGPESCAICVDDFMARDQLRLLPCGHHFHLSCIDEWLINHSDLCPLCKNQVPHGDEEGDEAEEEEEEGLGRIRVRGARGRGNGGGRLPVNFRDLSLFPEESEEEGEGLWSRPQNRLLGSGRGIGGYGSV